MSHTAIVNATLIDGQGGNPVPNATILIEGNTFAAVGTAESVLVPDDAVVVDADGRTVIPGILNGNVHLIDGWLLCFPGGVEYLARWEGRLVDVIVEAAQVTLKNGVTTVFDTYNAVGPVLAARDKIAAGDAAGSRVFAAGNIVGMGGPFSVDFRAAARPHISRTFADRMDALFSAGVGSELMGLTANDVRPIIRDYLQRGVDMLKIAVSDHATGVVGFDRAYLSFSERVLETMVEEALDAGVPLLSHTTHLESLRIAVDLGFDVLIHGSMVGMHSIPQKQIDRIREKGLTVGIQTTTEAYIQKLIAAGNPFGYMLGGVNAENERRIIAAGIPVMLGTDAGCTSHDSHGRTFCPRRARQGDGGGWVNVQPALLD